MLTKLRGVVQTLLLHGAKTLADRNITPNQVSATAIVLAFLAGFCYWAWSYNRVLLVIAPTLYLISGTCDALDGAVARLTGQPTARGGFLDSLLDRYADSVILVALAVGGLCDSFWCSVALVGSLLVSYTRARAEAAGIEMETVGVAERAERIIVLAFASFLAFHWLEALNWSVIVLAVLTHVTVLQRALYFHKKSK
jgi:archaetidylinositol phosphate synthase